jgi:hypothetical protein
MAQAATQMRNEAQAQNPRAEFHGTFCWNELMTLDEKAAQQFYANTIGWSFDPMPMDWGTYWIIKQGDKRVGGMVEMKEKCPGISGDSWMPYLAVDDIDARAKKAIAAGASFIREPFDVPGIGRIAILREPGGAAVGWMTPNPSMS